MYSAFVKLLNMSAASAVLIAAVLVLRFFLRKVPKKYICILWAFVALRLICPVSFSSRASVYNHVGTYRPANGQIEYIQYNEKTEKPMGEIPFATTQATSDGPTMTVHRPNFYLPTAMLIWAVGMAGMLLYAAISYYRIWKRTRESIPYKRNLYLCDRIPTPFILGMVKPRIFLPSDMTEEQIRSVVAHERAHIARRDHWWKPFGFLLLSIHWFNPLVWVAYGLLCRDIELACDEKVIANMSSPQKQAYSAVLLSCSMPRGFITACPLAFGEVGVKQRIQGILNYKKPSFWVILVTLLICLAVGVGFLTNPERKGDYLIVKSSQTKPTKPQTAEFKINTGTFIHTTTIYTELWRNGVCEKSVPLQLPETVKKIRLTMTGLKNGDSLAGYQVQVDTDIRDLSMVTTIPLPEETYLMKYYEWHGVKDINLSTNQEVLLGAALLDSGSGGFILFDFDNGDYAQCADRLQNQDCVILVRAAFQTEEVEVERTEEPAVNVPVEFLDYLNPLRVELRDDTSIERSESETSMTLEELVSSTDSWNFAYDIPGVTGPGWIRRGIILYYENGTELVIRYDADALCVFNINGDCLAVITCDYTGAQMVDMLWDWAAAQKHLGATYETDLTLEQRATPGKLAVMMHPTSATSIDGMGYVCPPNQEQWIEAWNAVVHSQNAIPINANGETYYGLYLYWEDTYLEVHQDRQGLYLRRMGTGEGYTAEMSQPLMALLEPILQDFHHNPVKPSDLKGITNASLVLDGMQYTILKGDTRVDTRLKQLETILTSAKPVGYMTACWFTSQLTVTLENGRSYTVSVATDSCGAYLSDGVCYEFPGDNTKLYQLFGLNLSEENTQQETVS
ncbi:MAG: M56 family metallopeptidase [Faecousia sp.]